MFPVGLAHLVVERLAHEAHDVGQFPGRTRIQGKGLAVLEISSNTRCDRRIGATNPWASPHVASCPDRHRPIASAAVSPHERLRCANRRARPAQRSYSSLPQARRRRPPRLWIGQGGKRLGASWVTIRLATASLPPCRPPPPPIRNSPRNPVRGGDTRWHCRKPASVGRYPALPKGIAVRPRLSWDQSPHRTT